MSERYDPGRAEDARPEAADLVQRLEAWAAAEGRHLNPDAEMVFDLAVGLLVNERRYGTMVCPCRAADGRLSRDLDIICPCDYRVADIAEHGTCYCGLYVSEAARRGAVPIGSIPERRRDPDLIEERAAGLGPEAGVRSPAADERLRLWRCTKCGYICERDAPPLHCPVCLAGQDRFEPAPARQPQ